MPQNASPLRAPHAAGFGRSNASKHVTAKTPPSSLANTLSFRWVAPLGLRPTLAASLGAKAPALVGLATGLRPLTPPENRPLPTSYLHSGRLPLQRPSPF